MFVLFDITFVSSGFDSLLFHFVQLLCHCDLVFRFGAASFHFVEMGVHFSFVLFQVHSASFHRACFWYSLHKNQGRLISLCFSEISMWSRFSSMSFHCCSMSLGLPFVWFRFSSGCLHGSLCSFRFGLHSFQFGFASSHLDSISLFVRFVSFHFTSASFHWASVAFRFGLGWFLFASAWFHYVSMLFLSTFCFTAIQFRLVSLFFWFISLWSRLNSTWFSFFLVVVPLDFVLSL